MISARITDWLRLHNRSDTKSSETHPAFSDGGQDGSAYHAGVGVQPEVIEEQTGGQQDGSGVGRVALGDALARVPGALQGGAESQLLY